jgi:hypothetical protein
MTGSCFRSDTRDSDEDRTVACAMERQPNLKDDHTELLDTKTSLRLGYSFYKEDKEDEDEDKDEDEDEDDFCDIFACSSSAYEQPYNKESPHSNDDVKLVVYDEQAVIAYDHGELCHTRTSSRLGYSFEVQNEDDVDCDVFLCNSSRLQSFYKEYIRRNNILAFIFVHDEKATNAFDHAELFTKRTLSNLGYIFDDDCEVWACNNSGICSCGIEEASESVIDISASMDVPAPTVQYLEYRTMIKHRKAWSGMKGQYGGSGRSKKQSSYNMSNIGHIVHNGGGYDCDIFIWQQLCAAGMPPHPGPEAEAWLACCGRSSNAAESFETLLTSAETCGVPRPSGQHNGLFVDEPSKQHRSGADVSDDQAILRCGV